MVCCAGQFKETASIRGAIRGAIRRAICGSILLVLCSPCHSLEVAAVQLEINEAVYSSVGGFRHRVRTVVEEISGSGNPDLIVFPEYTAVFLACIPYYSAITASQTFAEAMGRIRQAHPEIADLKALFVRASPWVEEVVEQVFGSLAASHNTYILAGTYFAAVENDVGAISLRNRATVFGPDGNRAYFQDKVFLTDFERQILRLSPGEVSDAGGFRIDGTSIVMTICKDTYERVWETRFSSGDLWIDIKANGEEFTRQTRESFERALPSRMRRVAVTYGLTVCLTGHFLDLFWEGKSSLVQRRSRNGYGDIVVIGEAATAEGEEILRFTLQEYRQ